MALTWENRHQNYSVVSVCEALRYNPFNEVAGYSPVPTNLKTIEHSLHRGDCQDNLIMTSPGGWLELEEAPVFTKDGRRFAMALSANGYKQVTMMDGCKFFEHLEVLYFYQVNVVNRDTNQRVPITSGSMVVTNIYHWDEVNRIFLHRCCSNFLF